MQQLKIKSEKQVVQNGFVTYSQEIVELAKQGYVLDIRNKTSPQFQLGLFVCNMLLLEDDVVEDNNIVVPSQVESVAADNVVPPAKKAAGRPSKADKAKAELQAKLGDQANSIR